MKKFYILLVALFIVNGAVAQWTALSSGTTEWLYSVHFTDANNGYVGGYGTFLKTTNGGNAWNVIEMGGPVTVNSIDFPSANIGYVSGSGWNGQMYKTIDAGTTWIPYPGYLEGDLYSVFFTDNNIGYTAGSYVNTSTGYWCDISKTTDGGMTWNIIAQKWDTYIYSLFFTDSNKGYAAGFSTGPIIMKTNDGGANWTTSYHPLTGGVFQSVFFHNADTGYAVGWGTIVKTTNGGTTWTEMWSGKEWEFKSVYFTSADTGYIVGGNAPDTSIILKTVNGGTTWEEQPTGTNVLLTSVFFPSVDTGYVVGWDGTILKTTNGGGYPVGLAGLHGKSDCLKIYPNPASDKITIETAFKGQISILNLSGQESVKKAASDFKTIIDISNLESGIFVVKFTGERDVRVGKIIKE